jgi:hypothetical protein
LTVDRTPEERTRLARDVAFNNFFMLLGSLLFGLKILEFFGVTVPVVRVAGGLIVAWMGWELLNEGAEPPERQALTKEEQPASITIGDSVARAVCRLCSGPDEPTNLPYACEYHIGALFPEAILCSLTQCGFVRFYCLALLNLLLSFRAA